MLEENADLNEVLTRNWKQLWNLETLKTLKSSVKFENTEQESEWKI